MKGPAAASEKRAWRNYWPISTLTPRSNIPTLGCDLWNYCSASEICFWGALSASQCAVKTGEKRDTRRRSLTVDVAWKRTTRTMMFLYSWERQSTERPFFTFKLPVSCSFTVNSRYCPLSQNYFKDSAVIPEIILVFQNQMRDVWQRGESAAITRLPVRIRKKKNNKKLNNSTRSNLVGCCCASTNHLSPANQRSRLTTRII